MTGSSQFAVSLGVLHFNLSLLNVSIFLGGGGYLNWVKFVIMELSCWLQAILFRARGG